MFDLEKATQDWRRGMTLSDTIPPQAIGELELHLIEETEALIARGLSQEESFIIAAGRVGSPDALREQFARVRPGWAWGQRILWMSMGALGLAALSKTASTLGWLIGGGWSDLTDNLATISQTLQTWQAWALITGGAGVSLLIYKLMRILLPKQPWLANGLVASIGLYWLTQLILIATAGSMSQEAMGRSAYNAMFGQILWVVGLGAGMLGGAWLVRRNQRVRQ